MEKREIGTISYNGEPKYSYYRLSVWNKETAKPSKTSLCCSTSDDFTDLVYNMSLYTIKDDEIYIIDLIEPNMEGKEIEVASWYYNNKREQIDWD